MPGRAIAVIGGGISGLAAAYVLSRSDRVTLFGADARLGGHADTHLVGPAGAQIPVDTGFIVYNERTRTGAGTRRAHRAADHHHAARRDARHAPDLHLDAKYIFPGGMIPSLTAIEQSLATRTRLRVTCRLDFGADYARTLCYAEAGFRSGYLGVSQLRLERSTSRT
jgi:predicted NAD/FAD-dependent oxidoreductase